jgi:hypothetical protein
VALFLCPFSHDTTLQDYRLPSVTTHVTRIVFLSREERTLQDLSTIKISDVCL